MKWQVSSSFTLSPNSCRLLILNQPLEGYAHNFILTLLGNASIIGCADGGANRLYNFLSAEERLQFLPNLIAGDFDSLTSDVHTFYQKQGVPMERIHDQDSTDFQKCLNHDKFKQDSRNDIYVLGALNGRLDHTMASMHTLMANPTSRIICISPDSIAYLIPPMIEHEIFIDLEWEGPTCGIFPLTGVALCNSSGLLWNLGMISN